MEINVFDVELPSVGGFLIISISSAGTVMLIMLLVLPTIPPLSGTETVLPPAMASLWIVICVGSTESLGITSENVKRRTLVSRFNVNEFNTGFVVSAITAAAKVSPTLSMPLPKTAVSLMLPEAICKYEVVYAGVRPGVIFRVFRLPAVNVSVTEVESVDEGVPPVSGSVTVAGSASAKVKPDGTMVAGSTGSEKVNSSIPELMSSRYEAKVGAVMSAPTDVAATPVVIPTMSIDFVSVTAPVAKVRNVLLVLVPMLRSAFRALRS